MDAIKKQNKIEDENAIQLGQVIDIPVNIANPDPDRGHQHPHPHPAGRRDTDARYSPPSRRPPRDNLFNNDMNEPPEQGGFSL